MTDEEIEKVIRAEYENCVISLGGKACTRKLHLPDESGDRPLCNSPKQIKDMPNEGYKTKPLAVYPIGTKDICKRCQDKFNGTEKTNTQRRISNDELKDIIKSLSKKSQHEKNMVLTKEIAELVPYTQGYVRTRTKEIEGIERARGKTTNGLQKPGFRVVD